MFFFIILKLHHKKIKNTLTILKNVQLNLNVIDLNCILKENYSILFLQFIKISFILHKPKNLLRFD